MKINLSSIAMLASLIGLFATLARSDENLDNPMEVLVECSAILANEDTDLTPQQIASAITSWENISNRSVGRRAATCITELTNHLWLFDADSGVITEASEQENADWILQSQKNAEIEEALVLQQSAERCALLKEIEENSEIVARFEAELEERRLLAQSEALLACQTWYLDHKVEALTNSVCHSYLTEFGVPIREGDVTFEEFEAASQLGAEAGEKLDYLLFGDRSSQDVGGSDLAVGTNTQAAFSATDGCE